MAGRVEIEGDSVEAAAITSVLVQGACWSEEGLEALVYSAVRGGLKIQGQMCGCRLLD